MNITITNNNLNDNTPPTRMGLAEEALKEKYNLKKKLIC